MDYIRNKDGSLPSETIQYLVVTYISFALFILFTIGGALAVFGPLRGGECSFVAGAIVFGSIYFGARIYMMMTKEMWFTDELEDRE